MANPLAHTASYPARSINRALNALLEASDWPLLPARLRLKRKLERLRRSGLFDAEWYLREYTDVAEAGIDPLRHYIEFGAKEGRAPNPAVTRLNGKA